MDTPDKADALTFKKYVTQKYLKEFRAVKGSYLHWKCKKESPKFESRKICAVLLVLFKTSYGVLTLKFFLEVGVSALLAATKATNLNKENKKLEILVNAIASQIWWSGFNFFRIVFFVILRPHEKHSA